MPIFFQQQINETTRLGVWKIEETEDFFKLNVPQHRLVTHPHKRLQHLAGRFLLQFLYPDFPYELIQIADTRKPFLPDEQYHFSISHCGDYAAVIVSRDRRVGIDIELIRPLVGQLVAKFLSEEEKKYLDNNNMLERATLLWSAKEAVFKWYGDGQVDFRQHIKLTAVDSGNQTIECFFSKTNQHLTLHYHQFNHLVLAWVVQ
jgi:phosphopantetheinyl transferase